MTEVTPLQRARRRAAAFSLASGENQIPFRCSFCRGTNINKVKRGYDCLGCGRHSEDKDVHDIRLTEMKAFIQEGIDIRIPKRSKT